MISQPVFNLTVKSLLVVSTLCFIIGPLAIFLTHQDLQIDGLDAWFVLLLNMVLIMLPLALAWWTYFKARNAPINVASFVYLTVTAVFSLSLAVFVATTVIRLHDGSNINPINFSVPWTVNNAIIFTLMYAVLLVYFIVKSKRNSA